MLHDRELLLPLLKQMLKCCQDIQESLRDDKNSFVKNDMASIEISNRKKTEILEKLNFLAMKLNSPSQSMTLSERIEQEAAELKSNAKQELTHLASQLKQEVAACYKCIMTNSTIVFSNLQQLKEIWDKLRSYNSSNHCVYDDKGSIK